MHANGTTFTEIRLIWHENKALLYRYGTLILKGQDFLLMIKASYLNESLNFYPLKANSYMRSLIISEDKIFFK